MNDRISAPGSAVGAAAIDAVGLGRKYRRGWALRDCTFRLPAGRICALVGPNGAGKSTLLSIAADLLDPTEGGVTLFGGAPCAPETRARVAFLAQDKPLYKHFTVAETLRLGRELNPGWDQESAERIIDQGRISLDSRINALSGGQRTRVAFSLAFGKRPDLMLLDEPMADIDPLARHELMGALMAEAAEHGTTVVISSHVIAELEGACDYLLMIDGGTVRLAGGIDDIVDAHTLVTGVHEGPGLPPEFAAATVVETRTTGRQFTALVRHGVPAAPAWETTAASLEEILIAHLRSGDAPPLVTADARTDTQDAVTA